MLRKFQYIVLLCTINEFVWPYTLWRTLKIRRAGRLKTVISETLDFSGLLSHFQMYSSTLCESS